MKSDLTPAELDVLRALWRLRKATVAQVRDEYARLSGGDPAYTTVMTLLGRMVAKGAVAVDKEREPFVYRPLERERQVVRKKLRELVDTFFAGKPDDLILQLVDDEKLSPDTLRRLEQRLAERGQADEPANEPSSEPQKGGGDR
jgi:predicted transcriptional regulator